VQESLGLMSVLAAGFAKVRKEYASFAQLTPDTARQFLTQYESDAGLFGHANDATKWAGVQVCRKVQTEGKDPRPLASFQTSLLKWAEALAGSDGMAVSEQAVLGSLRQLWGSAGPSDPSSPVQEKSMSEDQIQGDYQACEDLLWSGDSRDDYIKEHIDRLSIWRKSAEAMDPRGQLLYGLCFFYGHGEAESESTAVEWFRRSADQGDANAQYNLGMCFSNGWGVEQDEGTATHWFRKVSAQGHRGSAKVLTKAIAEQFVADDSSVYLDEFTDIDDEAAAILSTYQGTLGLPQLFNLTDSAAHSLSQHSGDLDLKRIENLSASAAKALAQHRGTLDLSLLETLCGVDARLFRDLNKLAPFSIFENFTPEMEELYRQAKLAAEDDLGNALLYCHSPANGRNSHDSFFDFWGSLSKCRNFPLWLMYDESDESWNFFEGTQEEVIASLKSIAEK